MEDEDMNAVVEALRGLVEGVEFSRGQAVAYGEGGMGRRRFRNLVRKAVHRAGLGGTHRVVSMPDGSFLIKPRKGLET